MTGPSSAPRPTASSITDDQLDELLAERDQHAARLADVLGVAEVIDAEIRADVERYLAALHRHAGAHDRLGAGWACAGCDLLLRITATPAPHGGPERPAGVETDPDATEGENAPQTGTQRTERDAAALTRVRALATLLPPDPGGDAELAAAYTAGWNDAIDRIDREIATP